MRCLLFDVEGTVSSLAFVKEELFPYARAALPAFLRDHADRSDVRPILGRLRHELSTERVDDIAAALVRWIDEDRKDSELKELQGLIWERGYRDGALRGHLYADVLPFWRRAVAAGVTLAMYSSGSEQAQRLLLRHSTEGDVADLFARHFDTRVGGKMEPRSYERIASELSLMPRDIRFYSDSVAELDAAADAGMDTCRVLRPGVPRREHRHREIDDFSTERL